MAANDAIFGYGMLERLVLAYSRLAYRSGARCSITLLLRQQQQRYLNALSLHLQSKMPHWINHRASLALKERVQPTRIRISFQANLWTEYISNEDTVEYMLFPRLCAMSEALWSPVHERNWPNFLARLRRNIPHLEARNFKYRPLD